MCGQNCIYIKTLLNKDVTLMGTPHNNFFLVLFLDQKFHVIKVFAD